MKNHLLLYVLLPLIVLSAGSAYYRFIVQHDYMVTYSSDCNPARDSCYVECADKECTEEYTYSLIEKHAADVYAQCGPDITDCKEAYVCANSDTACSVTYCNPETEAGACALFEGQEIVDEASVLLLEESIKE